LNATIIHELEVKGKNEPYLLKISNVF